MDELNPTPYEITAMDQATMVRIKTLALAGTGLSDASMTLARVNVFIEHMIGEVATSDARRRFEQRWLNFLNDQLDGIESRARLAKLTAGVNGASIPPRPKLAGP